MAFHIRRVLVAEGNEADRASAVASLKEFGRWTVAIATSADELVRLATKNKPDVVLLGDALAGTATVELAKRLRENPETAALNIVVMASGTPKELSDLSRAAQAKGVIRKPLGGPEFPDQIRNLVGAEAGANPDVLFRGK